MEHFGPAAARVFDGVVRYCTVLACVALVAATGAAEPPSGPPKCEDVFDKQDAPGAPAGVLAVAGFGREVMAAHDCVAKNNIPMACEHYRRVLQRLDKMDPEFAASYSTDVKAQMQQYKCQ